MSAVADHRVAAVPQPVDTLPHGFVGTPVTASGARALGRAQRGRKALQVGADVAAVAAGLGAAHALRQAWPDDEATDGRAHALLVLTALLLAPLVFARYRLYSARQIGSRLEEVSRCAHAVLVLCLLLAVGAFMGELEISRAWLVLALPCTLATVGIDRELTRHHFQRLRASGRLLRPVVVVGGNAEAEALAAMLDGQPALGYRVLGFTADDVPPGPLAPGAPPVLGPVAATVDVVAATGASTAIIATTAVDVRTANLLARRLQDRGTHVELSSGLRDIAAERLTVRALGRHPVFYLEPTVRSGWRAAAKRSFDLAASLAALVVLSPLLLVAGVAVKVTSQGPVLFRQERVGREGRTFRVLKLRTMVADAEARLPELQAANEADGPLFKMRDDPRVTRVGRLLRKLSIDELPQLWNVVRGEMSLVGPRPALPGEAATWGPEVAQRLRVKPGITGMWQVHGRSGTSFDEYVRLDLYYVDNWTLLADLTIILKTIPAVLLAKGAM